MPVQRVGFPRFFVRFSDALLDRVVKLEDAGLDHLGADRILEEHADFGDQAYV
jgi:hypothetical protein